MNHLCKILCSFCFSWHCEIPTYQCREWKNTQYGEQRCMRGVFAVNSCDDQEREAYEASFEECPVTASLNLNVSWYISITNQKILQRGSRWNAQPIAGAASSPPASKRGLSRVGAAMARTHSLPYVTALLELTSLTCSRAPHKRNPCPKDVCRAERLFFFSLLSRTLTVLFSAVVRGFSSPASHWCFLKAGNWKRNAAITSDCCLCCVCQHHADPPWALRPMPPTSLPSWKAAAGRDSHFLQKQGKTKASHRVHRCFPRTYA